MRSFTYRVNASGEGAVASRIRAGRHEFLVDEPAALAGDDVAAVGPVEVALGALLSCQVVVYRLYAQALGIRVDEIDIAAEGDLDARRLFAIDESVGRASAPCASPSRILTPRTRERCPELHRLR